jgi:hypothetical protein
MKLEVLMALIVSRDIATCSLVEIERRFRVDPSVGGDNKHVWKIGRFQVPSGLELFCVMARENGKYENVITRRSHFKDTRHMS